MLQRKLAARTRQTAAALRFALAKGRSLEKLAVKRFSLTEPFK